MDATREEITNFTFFKAVKEIIPNLIFFGVGVVVIIFLGKQFNWIGLVGLAVYCLIFLFDLIRVITLTVSTIILSFPQNKDDTLKVKMINLATTVIHLVGTGVFCFYVILLYRQFSPFI